MRKFLYILPLLAISCGFLKAFTGEATPEEAEQAALLIQQLGELGVQFITPQESIVSNAITGITTGLAVWLGRNATRKRDIGKVTNGSV